MINNKISGVGRVLDIRSDAGKEGGKGPYIRIKAETAPGQYVYLHAYTREIREQAGTLQQGDTFTFSGKGRISRRKNGKRAFFIVTAETIRAEAREPERAEWTLTGEIAGDRMHFFQQGSGNTVSFALEVTEERGEETEYTILIQHSKRQAEYFKTHFEAGQFIRVTGWPGQIKREKGNEPVLVADCIRNASEQ